ncbi:MAG: hypothetical protein R2762_27215 [Bryobacteraceae bacterium]
MLSPTPGAGRSPGRRRPVGRWLTLSTASGTAPSPVTASVNLTGLGGDINGQVTVTPSVGPPQVIAVTLTLTDPPRVSASPSVLTFTGVTGGANPAGQSIAIANTRVGRSPGRLRPISRG